MFPDNFMEQNVEVNDSMEFEEKSSEHVNPIRFLIVVRTFVRALYYITEKVCIKLH